MRGFSPAAQAKRAEGHAAYVAERRSERAQAAIAERQAAGSVSPLAAQLAQFVTPEWPLAKIERLWMGWLDGDSAPTLARRIGMSKGALLGKAHRIGLPARPSPIERSAEPRPASPPKPPRVRHAATLPPLSSATSLVPAQILPVAEPAQPLPAAAWAAPPVSQPYGRIVTCCWPIGEPGTRSFRFCEAQSVPGKPYCEPHAKKAYVRVTVPARQIAEVA